MQLRGERNGSQRQRDDPKDESLGNRFSERGTRMCAKSESSSNDGRFQRNMKMSAILAAMMVLVSWAGVSANHAKPQVPCLPPGVTAEFFTWPITHMATSILSKDGHPVPGFYVIHRHEDHAVAVLWAGQDLMVVDPSPDGDDTVWVDRGVASDSLGIRQVPGEPCQWTRVEATIRDVRQSPKGERPTSTF